MRRHKPNAYDYNALGASFYQAGAYGLAIAQLEEAVRMAPTVAAYRFNLGGAYYGKGRLGDAERAFREALWLDGQHAGAHYFLAVCLERAGRIREALAEYGWVRAHAPDTGEGRKADEAIRALGGSSPPPGVSSRDKAADAGPDSRHP